MVKLELLAGTFPPSKLSNVHTYLHDMSGDAVCPAGHVGNFFPAILSNLEAIRVWKYNLSVLVMSYEYFQWYLKYFI